MKMTYDNYSKCWLAGTEENGFGIVRFRGAYYVNIVIKGNPIEVEREPFGDLDDAEYAAIKAFTKLSPDKREG